MAWCCHVYEDIWCLIMALDHDELKIVTIYKDFLSLFLKEALIC